MKPFTLGWWLLQLSSSLGRYDANRELFYDRGMKESAELADWIKKRIIKKYGEES